MKTIANNPIDLLIFFSYFLFDLIELLVIAKIIASPPPPGGINASL